MGSQDAINLLRPLVGYGPEAMWVAFNRFYPPDLAHIEARNASPDRSHNETWDSLVVTGILGFVAYMAVFISIFYWALRWLGLIVHRRDTILFGVLLAVGALGQWCGFYFFDNQQLRLFGVALPFGLMGGLCGLHLHCCLSPRRHAPRSRRSAPPDADRRPAGGHRGPLPGDSLRHQHRRHTHQFLGALPRRSWWWACGWRRCSRWPSSRRRQPPSRRLLQPLYRRAGNQQEARANQPAPEPRRLRQRPSPNPAGFAAPSTRSQCCLLLC